MAEDIKIKLNQQNSIKYFYNTRRFLVWAVFLGVLAVGLTIFSLIPQVQSASGLYSDMLKEGKRLAQLKLKLAQLDDAANTAIMINADKINAVLPSKKPLLELLTGLNNIGGKSNVIFSNISLTPGKISTDSAEVETNVRKRSRTLVNRQYESLDLDVTVTGPISNVNQFLKQVEMMAPFTNVTAMTLNEKTGPSGIEGGVDSSYEAKVTITTYFFNRPLTATIDAAIPELSAAQQKTIDEIQDFTYTTVQAQDEIRGGGLENLFPNVSTIPGIEDL